MRELIPAACEQARLLGHESVGTEMLLLALAELRSGIVAEALRLHGVTWKKAREEVKKIIGYGSGFVPEQVPLTPGAKHTLTAAGTQARNLKSKRIGPEHVLLSILSENQGVSADVLKAMNVNCSELRDEVLRLIEKRGDSDLPTFNSQKAKQEYLDHIKGQIQAWQARADMAQQQKNDELAQVALEKKKVFEKRYGEVLELEIFEDEVELE